MDVIFTGSNLPLALAIKMFTGGCPYNHCGHIIGDQVVEARFLKGVVITPLEEVKKRGPWVIKRYPVPFQNLAEATSKMLVGMGYDTMGALGHPFGGKWDRLEKWYCSEHVEYSMSQGGLKAFKDSKSTTPRDIYIMGCGEFVSKGNH